MATIPVTPLVLAGQFLLIIPNFTHKYSVSFAEKEILQLHPSRMCGCIVLTLHKNPLGLNSGVCKSRYTVSKRLIDKQF